MCRHFRSIQTGGGKSGGNRASLGRPKTNTSRDLAAQVTAMAPAPFFSPLTPLPLAHTSTNVWCVVCMEVLDRPIELGCGNLICLLCCTKCLGTSTNCPCCCSSLVNHTHSPSRVTMDIVGSQLVVCGKGCNRVVKAEQYFSHTRSQCQAFFEHSVHSPSRSTIRDLLDKHMETPTTNTEKRVANSLIKRLMAENRDESVLQLTTGGQVKKICVSQLHTDQQYYDSHFPFYL